MRVSTRKLMALTVLSLAGQMLVTGPVSAQAGETSGYIWASPVSIVFIQLTQVGNYLTGSWQEVDEDTYTMDLSSSHFDVNGVKQGSSVQLGVLGVGKLGGAIKGKNLVLSVPQSNGSLAKITLKPGTISMYNRYLAALKQRINAQQTAGSNDAQVDDSDQQFQNDWSALKADVIGINGWVPEAVQDLASVKKWLKAVQGDQQTVMSGLSSGASVDQDLQQLQYDVGNLDDVGQNESDTTSLLPDAVSQLNDHLSSFLSDYNTLVKDERKVPSYRPDPPIPSKAAVDKYVKNVRASVKNNVGKLKQYWPQISAIVSQGDQIAQDVQSAVANAQQQADRSSSGSTAPQTVPPLAAVLQQGNTPGSMQISVPYGFDPSTDSLMYDFLNSVTPTPNVGDTVPWKSVV